MPPSFAPWALCRQKCQPRLDMGPGELGPQALSMCCSHRYRESFFFGLTEGVWWAVSYPHTRPEALFLCPSPALIKVSLHFLVQNSLGSIVGPPASSYAPTRSHKHPFGCFVCTSFKIFSFSPVLKKLTVLGGSSSLLIITLTWVFSSAYPAPNLSQTYKREQEAAEGNGLWTTQ